MELVVVTNSDRDLRDMMSIHYSNPGGFVGRNICYAIMHDGCLYGFIVSGSAAKHLPNRDKFLGVASSKYLNNIINNTFFHVEKLDGKYPYRNFVPSVVREWERTTPSLWKRKYGDNVIALETLVEPPRTGEVYRRCGWTEIGITKGYTCKRVGGKGTDSWGGRRVWNTKDLKPKIILMKKLNGGG